MAEMAEPVHFIPQQSQLTSPTFDHTRTYDPSIKAFGTVAFPGPMRLLIGLGGEVYFTGDHYGSGLQNNAYYVNPTPAFGTFRITNITKEANNIRISWQTVDGTTNVVQTAAGASGGSSNNFSNQIGRASCRER